MLFGLFLFVLFFPTQVALSFQDGQIWQNQVTGEKGNPGGSRGV